MLRRSPLVPIALIVLVDVFGLTLVIPLLAIYAEQFGATAFEASLLVPVFALCQLVAGPLLGRWSDTAGRKRVLLLSQVGTLVGFLVMAGAQSLPLLFLARVIDGATAGNLSVAQAYIADHTAPENRARAFGLIGVAFGLGFFIGPSISGVLAQHVGLRAPIFLAAGMSLLSILCTAALLPGGEVAQVQAGVARGRGLGGVFAWRAWAGYFTRPTLGGLLVQFLLFAFAFSTFTSCFPLFAERRFTWQGRPYGPQEIGHLYAYSGFIGLVLQGGLLGRLVRRFGEARLVGFGFAVSLVGYVGLGLVRDTVGLVAVATVGGVGSSLLRPCLTSLVSRHAHGGEQGAVMGLTQSMVSLSSVVAAPVGGALITAGWLSTWAWMAAAAYGVGLAVFVRSARGLAARASVS